MKKNLIQLLAVLGLLGVVACGQKTNDAMIGGADQFDFIDPAAMGIATFKPESMVRSKMQLAENNNQDADLELDVYVNDDWKESFGDLSKYQVGFYRAVRSYILNTHPAAQEHFKSSKANSVRHLFLNSEKSLDILPLDISQKYKVKCLETTTKYCLVDVNDSRKAFKVVKTKRELYSVLRAQLDVFNESSEEENVEMVDKFLTYIAKNKIRLPDNPYAEIIQINGMLEGLDPHSSIIDKEFLEQMKGNGDDDIEGIGVDARFFGKNVVFTEIIENSGAEEAGLQSGDVLASINGVSINSDTYQKNNKVILSKVIGDLKGPANTKVTIEVKRLGELKKIEIQRKKMVVKNTTPKEYEDAHYVKYRVFTSDSVNTFKNTIQQMESDSTKPLVLDIRGNPGGDVEAVVDILKFLTSAADQPMFYDLMVRNGINFFDNFKMGAVKSDTNLPIVLLIDAMSASASEILASNLKHLERAVVIGDQSFGKGTAQTVGSIRGTDEIAFKYTMGMYYTSLDYAVQYQGVEPHVKAVQTPHLPEFYVDELREKDFPLAIKPRKGQSEFSYEMSNELKAKVDCAKELDAKMLPEYLEETKTNIYPGDYSMRLALSVSKNCM